MFIAFDMSSAYAWEEERRALVKEVLSDPTIAEIFVMQFDAQVTYSEVIPRSNIDRLMSMPLHGHGGTMITPVQDCVRLHGGDKVRVYSDGYFVDTPDQDVQLDLFNPQP